MSCFLIKKAVIITLMGDKKIFSTRVDDDRIKDLKHLAVDTDKSLGELLEEAIQDIVKKYDKKLKK
jgi:predicted transcriptional regulator